jgi:2-dehydro-3-deoxygluconokinase
MAATEDPLIHGQQRSALSQGICLERRLRGEGVRVHAIRDGGWTGIMLRHQRFAGHLEVDYHRAGSAASLLRPADIPDELLRRAQIVHVTGITPALSRSACDAVERARSYGAIVCFDVNYRSKLWDPGRALPVLRALAAQVHILLAGVDEARLVLGGLEDAPASELARAVADLGPGEAVITDRGRGCAALIGGTLHEQPGLDVPVRDPVRRRCIRGRVPDRAPRRAGAGGPAAHRGSRRRLCGRGAR